jgi:hypothetical protein
VVRQNVRHNGFQAAATSIGPRLIPCPGCNLEIVSGQSEWNEKSLFGKSSFLFGRFVWWIVGSLFLALPLSVIFVWIGEGLEQMDPLEKNANIAKTFVMFSFLLGVVLIRNIFWEIRESRKRTADANVRVV